MNKRILLSSILAMAAGCASDTALDSGSEVVEDLYSLSLNVTIDGEDGEVIFLTPTASPQNFATQDLIGKPWYVGFFDAGAQPGVDPADVQHWGTVDETLEFSFTSPAVFENGSHDALFVIYVNAEVSEDDKAGDFPPLAITGDLSSFTLAERVLTEGEPDLAAGYLRFKVEDTDTEMDIRNKTPNDWENTAQLVDSFINTVLVVP